MNPKYSRNISLTLSDVEMEKKAQSNGWKWTWIYREGLKVCAATKPSFKPAQSLKK